MSAASSRSWDCRPARRRRRMPTNTTWHRRCLRRITYSQQPRFDDSSDASETPVLLPSSSVHHAKDEAMAINNQAATTREAEVAPPEAWDAIAGGYDEFVAPGESPFANAGLRLASLTSGQRFLDVAAGTGGLSLPAARLGARVLATDWSPAMISRFEARVREDGLRDAEGRVMDCHALALPDDSFDLTGSQFGVMLVPDQPRALREMVRVTRPGGRVLVIAYGSPAELEFLQFFVSAL